MPWTYGDTWSDCYDEFAALFNKDADTPAIVEFLSSYHFQGTAFEMGIGHGHIAIALADAGFAVSGIDNSAKMIESLHKRRGDSPVNAWVEDICSFSLMQSPDLIYCINGVLTYLLTQDDQIRCFENVAAVMHQDSVFIVQQNYPQTNDFTGNGIYGDQKTNVLHVSDNEVLVRFTKQDRQNQWFLSQDIWVSGKQTMLLPQVSRYIFPSELDLLARLVGLKLKERFWGWRREAFSSAAWKYVSVYSKGK